MGRTIDLGAHRPLTRRVTALFRTATDAQVYRGLAWYVDASAQARELGERFGYEHEQACGVIAALSPQTAWWQNVMLAKQAMTAGAMVQGHTRDAMRKVNAILSGVDPLDALGGLKVRSFYENLRYEGQDDGVTIDRHAWDIATGLKGYAQSLTITPGRYAQAAEAYRRAADILNREYGLRMTGAEVQAVTWVTWRDAHGIRD